MSEWFYAKDGQTSDPLSKEELLQLLATGTLQPSDLVWRKGMNAWISASSVQELQPEAPPPLPHPHPSIQDSNLYAPPASLSPESESPHFDLEPVSPGTHILSPVSCIRDSASLIFSKFTKLLPILLVYAAIVIAVSFATEWLDVRLGFVTPQPETSNPTSFEEIIASIGSQSLFSRIVNTMTEVFLGIGFTTICLKIIRNQTFSLRDLFSGGSLLIRCFIAQFIFNFVVGLGLLLFIIPGLYLATRYVHYQVALIDHKLTIGQAFEFSSQITTNNRLRILGLLGLAFLVILVGFIALVIGLFAAMPIAQMALVLAYHRLTYDQPRSYHPGSPS